MVYFNTAVYIWGEMCMVNLVTCILSLLEALNDALEVQFSGFIYTLYLRH